MRSASVIQEIDDKPAVRSFYHRQFLQIKKKIFPHDDLYARVIKAKAFIDSCYFENINIDEMANKACFSKFHFIRLFKKSYGLTPYRYLTEVRIERAKHLLQSGMPVADVCAAVGFDSITSFNGLFKKIAGTPPFLFQKTKSSGKKGNFQEAQ